jgi:hypothetical protein
MNDNKLKRLFPNASPSFIKSNSDTHQRLSNPIVQEFKDDHHKEPRENASSSNADNRSKEKESNGSDDPNYQITIDINVSDRRIRDLDGAATTCLDALITARRQLLDSAGSPYPIKKSFKG